MANNIYIYILIMAAVTYLIRVLPLTLIRKEIKNTTIKSFLYYVPYVTLAVMTFPAILSATDSVISAGVAFVVAILLAWFNKSLFQVAVFSCLSVFIIEMIISFLQL
ncbi:MAG: AzlD domain-containing protein [Lachnospira sp.]